MVTVVALALVLAEAKVTASATGGLTVSTTEELGSTRPTVTGAPLVAVRLDVEKRWSAGTVRARFAPLLSTAQPAFFGMVTTTPVLFLTDLASFLEYESPAFAGGDTRLAVRLSPFQGNTRLVSFDWANAITRTTAPVLSVDLRSGAWTGWLAGRFPTGTPFMMGPLAGPALNPEVLAGVGWRGERLRVEVRAGRTQYGRFAQPGLTSPGPPQWGFLAAGQAVFHVGEELPPALDLVTYRNDPARFDGFFAPQPVPVGAVAFTALVELGAGTQSVSRAPGRLPSESTVLPGWVDLQARLRVHQTRVFATVRAQSSAFLTFDLASRVVSSVFPAEGVSTPLVAGYLGVDHLFHRTNLTPQLLLRVVQPATLRPSPPGADFVAPPGTPGRQGIVLREGGVWQVAGSPDVQPLPTLGAKVALRWNPVPALAVVAEVDAAFDLMTEVPVERPTQLVPGRRPALTTTSTVALQGRF
jgi:hypothetical protein